MLCRHQSSGRIIVCRRTKETLSCTFSFSQYSCIFCLCQWIHVARWADITKSLPLAQMIWNINLCKPSNSKTLVLRRQMLQRNQKAQMTSKTPSEFVFFSPCQLDESAVSCFLCSGLRDWSCIIREMKTWLKRSQISQSNHREAQFFVQATTAN